MAMEVDQRIVEMRFDNKQFEQNVSTTMSSLDKLKQSLKLEGSAEAAKSEFEAYKSGWFNLGDSMLKMMSSLEYQFGNWVGRILSGPIRQLKNVTNDMTVGAMKSGFKEYETQMGAVQTILSNTKSKGTDLEDVNAALDELNLYADKTIYNFTEMTRNIGTFTAAGVDLDTSVSAIKGIANLAAVSGSTSQQASTAMYQLSQALASGTVKLMDWNSVVNAGMGGQVFQDALKETARVHGVAIDDIIKKNGSFRESLSEGWLTSQILTETLSKFTGDLNEQQLKSMGYTDEQIKGIIELGKDANDAATKVKTFTQLYDTLKEAAQSGWSQTWRIVVGDFEEAKEMFTLVSDTLGAIIGQTSDTRNEMLSNWKAMGGRKDVVDAIANSFKAIMAIVEAVSEASKEIFPPMTAENLKSFTSKLNELSQKFLSFFKVLNEETGLYETTENFENLKRTFKGVFAVVDIARRIFLGLVKAIGTVLGVTDTVGGGFLSLTARIGDWLVLIRDATAATGIFENIFVGIATIIRSVVKWFANLGKVFSESFVFSAITEGLITVVSLLDDAKTETNHLAELGTRLGEAWANSRLYKVLTGIWSIIKKIGSGIADAFGGVFGGLFDAASEGNFELLFDILNGLLSGGLIVGLWKLVESLTTFLKPVQNLFKGITDAIEDVMGKVGDTFAAFQQKLKSEALMNIAKAILILVASLVVLTLIDNEKLERAMASLFILMTALSIMNHFMSAGKNVATLNKGGLNFEGTSNGLMSMALSLVALGLVLSKIGDMDWEQIGRGVVGIAGIMVVMLASQKIMTKFAESGDTLKTGSKAMLTMAISLLVLSVPLKAIGSMEWAQWGRAMMGIVIVLGALAAVQLMYGKLAEGSGKRLLAGAGAIAIMATSLSGLIPILTFFAIMPWQNLAQAGVALLLLLGMLGGVQAMYGHLGKGSQEMISGAGAIAIMAESINGLIPILLIFAVMPLPSLIQSLGSLLVLLGMLGGVQVMYGKLGNGAKSMLGGAGAIAIISASLSLLIPALIVIGSMKWHQVLQGVLAMTAVLIAMAATMGALNKFGGGPLNVAASAKAILTMAGALMLLAPALLMLGSLRVDQAAIAIGTLVIALAGLVGLAALLQKFIPTFLSFAAGIQAIGIGTLAAGAGLILLGLGITAIGIGLGKAAVGVAAFIAALGSVAVALTVVIAAVIEGVIRGLGQGIIALCEVLIDAMPLLADVVYEFIAMICDILIKSVPKLIDTILILALELCRGLVEYIPPIVAAIVELIAGIFDALAQTTGPLLNSIGNFLSALFTGILDAFGGIDNILKGVVALALLMGIFAAMKVLAVPAMIGVLAVGAVLLEFIGVLALLSLVAGGIDRIHKGGEVLQAVGKAIGQFVGGLVGGFAKGATEDLPDIATNLAKFAENIGGFLDIAPKLGTAIKSLTGAAVADTLSKWLFGSRTSAIDVLKRDLPKLGEGLAGFSDAIGDRKLADLVSPIKALSGLGEALSNISGSGGIHAKQFGAKDMSAFGKDLVDLAAGLVGFSDEISNANDPSFSNIDPAIDAIVKLAEMADEIPNSGGLVAWFTGDNSLANFGDDLVKLGRGIAGFAKEVVGVEDVSAAIKVAKALVELTNNIPNQGGVAGWFAGDKAIAGYSKDLKKLGQGINDFAIETKDVEPTKVESAVEAATLLVDMTNHIPNEGGVVAWFTGDNSLSHFGKDLGALGKGIFDFAKETDGISADTVKAAVDAAKVLAEMTAVIPNEGGVKAWFAGESSLSHFGKDLGALGAGISEFSKNTEKVTVETVKPAADAAKVLAEMTNTLPNEGGVQSWFAGESSISKFGNELADLGSGIASFAVNAGEVEPKKVESASTAAQKIAEMTKHIPNEGGIKAWFVGESSVAKFADHLPALGKGIAGFANGLGEAEISKITPAAEAAQKIAEMTNHIPNEGGIKAWFSGESSISSFADKLPILGAGIKKFSDKVTADGGINVESVETAANAAKTLSDMTGEVPKDSSKIVSFGDNLGKFGEKLKVFIASTAGITADSVKGANVVINLAKEAASIDAGNVKNLANRIEDLAQAVKDMEKNITSDMTKAGENAIAAYIDAMDSKMEDAEGKAEEVATNAAAKISAEGNRGGAFESAGENAASGYARGIRNGTNQAVNAAVAMVAATLTAIAEAQKSHSPSKETEKLGGYGGMGFVNGWYKYLSKAEDAGYDVGNSAINGLKDAIGRVKDAVENGVDAQPTIRPVLDMSEIEAGAQSIGGLFGTPSVGVAANIGAINSMMNSRVQNGTNEDVIAAIHELRDHLDNAGDTYQINGITYDDGSNIAEAVSTLIRAAKIERRV